jgi:hypothetical protein
MSCMFVYIRCSPLNGLSRPIRSAAVDPEILTSDTFVDLEINWAPDKQYAIQGNFNCCEYRYVRQIRHVLDVDMSTFAACHGKRNLELIKISHISWEIPRDNCSN